MTYIEFFTEHVNKLSQAYIIVIFTNTLWSLLLHFLFIWLWQFSLQSHLLNILLFIWMFFIYAWNAQKHSKYFKIFISKISRDDESTASAAVCLVEGVVAEPRLYNNVAVLELVSTGRTLRKTCQLIILLQAIKFQ